MTCVVVSTRPEARTRRLSPLVEDFQVAQALDSAPSPLFLHCPRSGGRGRTRARAVGVGGGDIAA